MVTGEEARDALAAKCDELKETLLRKNAAYGNSAIDPIRLFSKASPREQLLVRLDDKVSRISRGTKQDEVPEDTLLDIAGYIILLLVAQDAENSPVVPQKTNLGGCCPSCESPSRFNLDRPCDLDHYDPDPWHSTW